MRHMPEQPFKPLATPIITPVWSALHKAAAAQSDSKTLCERCGAEMYRMHAVWRCPSCRFKTDCCGW
jgi:hypothetical protein